jgi:predicted GNAT family acetyltransferase
MPIATGHAVHGDDWAGRAVAVGGIAVVETARRRGVGAAIASWLTAHGLARGAGLAHLHPDHDAAARVYARLGFVETPGLDIYVNL